MKMEVMTSRGIILMLILSVLLLFAIPTAIAVDTEIIVWTIPQDKISIQVLAPDQVYALLNSYHVYATETGKANITYSGSEEKINIKVAISREGIPLKFDDKDFQLFEKYNTGGKIYIQMIPKNVKIGYDDFDKPPAPVPVENVTDTSEINETNQTGNAEIEGENNNSILTGNAIMRNFQSNKKTYLYVIFGVVGCGIILFVGFIVRKKIINKFPREIKVTKLSESNFSDKRLERTIQEKEAKLKEVEAEINRLKNQGKIEEIERRIEEERKEVERLRKGGRN